MVLRRRRRAGKGMENGGKRNSMEAAMKKKVVGKSLIC